MTNIRMTAIDDGPSVAAQLCTSEGEPLVLEGVRATATLQDLLAEVTVAQRYRNDEPRNIEAVYTFPVPTNAVLLGFEVELGARTLVGRVTAKADAERDYENAIGDGDAAVLLEQVGKGLYTANLGNLLAGESAVLRIRYGLLLRWNGDRVRMMLPTTIAPRYGDPLRAGLAPQQVPEHSLGVERGFALDVTVRGLLHGADFRSPSHSVCVTHAEHETRIALQGEPPMDRDFVIEARAERAEASGAKVAKDGNGWVALASFRPTIGEDDAARQRRAITVVVDCSGSMGGDSIAQAKLALERILDGIRPGDGLEIVAFGSTQKTLFGSVMPVNEQTLAQARRFVRRLDADMGGTELARALDAAYTTACSVQAPRDVLLVTDGEVYPDPALYERAKQSRHRLFTVGVGSSVAEDVVRQLAEVTGGACELVSPREDMAGRIHRHFQRMYAPPAKRARVHWPATPTRVLPSRIETVYGGDTLHAYAWFDEEPRGVAALALELADGRTVRHEARIEAFGESQGTRLAFEEGLAPTLARMAAARRLVEIPDDRETASALAVEYQLVSPWTSYLVVHVRADAEKSQELPEIRRVKHTVPAGWHGMGTVGLGDHAYEALESAPCLDAGDEWLGCGREIEVLRKQPLASDVDDTSTALVRRLNVRGIAQLPTLDELESWGVPEPVIEELRALVDRAPYEESVVLAFLYALTESRAGRDLDRELRRKIRDAYRKGTIAPALELATARILADWS